MKKILPSILKPFDLDSNNHLDAAELEKLRNLPPSKLEPLMQDATYLLLREIGAAYKNARNRLVPSVGIEVDEFRILTFLEHVEKPEFGAKKTSQLTLAKELTIGTSTITNLLDKMDVARGDNAKKNRGWIARTENPENRKEKLISLTPEGRARVRSARKDFKRESSTGLLQRLEIDQILTLLAELFQFNVALDPGHDLNPTIGDADETPSTGETLSK